MKTAMPFWLTGMAILFLSGCGPSEQFDVVIRRGHVMDPESGLDAVRSIGIRDGKIAAIDSGRLKGTVVIDARGLIVAPGFIDLHAHGQTEENYRLMAQDGITSGLELEIGTADVADWYDERAGGQVINYGVSAGHIQVRMKVFGDKGGLLPSGPAIDRQASLDQINTMKSMLEAGLREGAVAVGFGLAYTPAATTSEFETMLRVVAEHGTTAHIHVKGGPEGLQDAIDSAAVTGASLHVVHANSSGGARISEFLEKIDLARVLGIDVTTEAYPYEAGMTSIQSALFNDWESWDDDDFKLHQWAETGERLTRRSFARYRNQGGLVISHTRTKEMTRKAIANPLTMIASDGLVTNDRGHPRTAGTYSKILGTYVREYGVLTLMDALSRMTIQPARRLEEYVPAMRAKGRIREGADADITIFDATTVIDQATYRNPTLPSQGIEFVLVNGVPVVFDGELIADARPGRAVRVQ